MLADTELNPLTFQAETDEEPGWAEWFADGASEIYDDAKEGLDRVGDILGKGVDNVTQAPGILAGTAGTGAAASMVLGTIGVLGLGWWLLK